MSAHGEVNLTWGDGDQVFNISKIGQALELQDKCGAGVGTIMNRLLTGSFMFNDFRETIRLGLIGGGMEPSAALTLTKRYVDERPWRESVLVATAIISSAMVGVPDEKVGKEPADQTASEATTTVALSDPPSTASAPPSDLALDKSTISPPGN